jgi:3-hydroxyisobutyrate dehydrogenase-like beta-hydroxyacid dehydrogenase
MLHTPKIAILGLGAMGLRIAQNLLSTNYSVFVYNRTPEKAKPLIDRGAIVAATPTLTAIHRVYQEAIVKQYGNDNIIGVVQLFVQ